MRDKIFYVICFGFVFGVLFRSFIFVNLFVAIFLGVIALALILFFDLISKNKWGVITGVFILAISLGILRFHVTDRLAPDIFESQVNQQVSFSGKIVDESDIRENNQKLTF